MAFAFTKIERNDLCFAKIPSSFHLTDMQALDCSASLPKNPKKPGGRKYFSAGLTVCHPDSHVSILPNAKRSLHSLLNLITDLLADGLLFFRLIFRSRKALSAEVLFLRKQLASYQERRVQPRRLNDSARFSLLLWSRLCDWKNALVIVKPETLIGRHRKGFKLFWRWKSQAGRPRLPEGIRQLIVQMAQENPTWGQARVAAELSVKLGIYVSPRTVCAYWPPEPEDLFAELEDAITPSLSSLAISWLW